MTIRAESLVETLRFFGSGRDYGDPYDTVATLVIVGNFAIMVAMHGRMTRAFWSELQDELKGRGVIDLLTVRHHDRCWYDLEGDEVTQHRGVRFPPIGYANPTPAG